MAGLVVWISAGLMVSGCVTVMSPAPGILSKTLPRDPGVATLQEAAAPLYETTWTAPTDDGMSARAAAIFLGMKNADQPDPAAEYVSLLQTQADETGRAPRTLLMADADIHLVAGERLANLALENASTGLRDRAALRTLEAAIAQVNDLKAVYLETLDRLAAPEADMLAVRTGFLTTTKALGQAADAIASSPDDQLSGDQELDNDGPNTGEDDKSVPPEDPKTPASLGANLIGVSAAMR